MGVHEAETKNDAKHPALHRITPTIRNLQTQYIHSVEVECDIVIYTKNTYLAFVPISGTQVLKLLEFLK